MIAGRKLLLADDSVAIQKVIDLTFTDEGMEVTTVGDGQDALAKLNQFTPDVVLADVYMPSVDGYELCKFIKQDERFRDIPVMLLVGSFEPFDEAEAKRAGADDVVTKPFQSIRDLVSRVGSLVSQDDSARREAAGKHSLLGLRQAEGEPAGDEPSEALSSNIAMPTEDPHSTPEENVRVFVEAPTMEPEASPVFVEAALMEDESATPEHTCPPDIELQTADTQQLTPVADSAMHGSNAGSEFDEAIELQVVDEGMSAGTTEAAYALPAPPAAERESAQPSNFNDDGVLDLGDVDSFAAATTEDDFELEVDVEMPASYGEKASLAAPTYEDAAASVSDESAVASRGVGGKPADQVMHSELSADAIEAISRRVVEQLSDKVVREIAWEVVPELSELLIKKQLDERR